MAKIKGEGNGAQFLKYFNPLLVALRNLGGSGTPEEVVDQIAHDLRISDGVQNETLESGQSRFRNQIAWARFYLVREGLIDSSRRGVWSLTEKGRTAQLSDAQVRRIRQKWVRFFQEQRRHGIEARNKKVDEQVAEEQIDSADYRLRLIEILRKLPPQGFEQFSQRILREAGFTQVTVTGKSGDGGIDGYGTLQVNALVSLKVLFQCKRYSGAVVPSHVRDFRGAMAGRADKGIIITTGTFTAEARREATRDGVPQIELLDGEKLIDMLEKLELGLKPILSYEIDRAFFAEFGPQSD